MNGPINRPVPSAQVRAFDLAVCKRLGLDPAEVSNINFDTMGDGSARLTITAWLTEDEVLHMFNTGKVPSRE